MTWKQKGEEWKEDKDKTPLLARYYEKRNAQNKETQQENYGDGNDVIQSHFL